MKHRVRWTVILAVAVFSLQVHAVDDSSTAEGHVVSIAIQGLSFNPARITVAPGTTIHWVNRDNVDHDVTSGESITGRKARSAARTKFPDGRFASGLFGQGQTFTVSFDKPGKYPYFCSIHPFMKGQVNVR